MVKIPGVNPLSEGTICRKRWKSSTDKAGKKAPSATVTAPTDDIIVEEKLETEVAASTPGSARASQQKKAGSTSTVAAAAGTPESVQQKKASSTSTVSGTVTKGSGAKSKVTKDDFDMTYLKENQCVCGYEVVDGSALCIHTKNQHPHSYNRCWGLLKLSTTGKQRCCPFKTEDQGVMWRQYRTKHLGLY